MPIIILAVVFFIGLGCGAALWFVFRRRQAAISQELTKETGTSLPLRWRYIILPLAILILAVILSAYFYHLLPTEVAYHFESDGTPDRWFSRGMAMVWGLVPQLLLTLLAAAIVWGITKLSIIPRQADNSQIRPERILSFMGNLIALPQLIVGFAMFDIFSYNAYQAHIMPMWLFLLITLGLAIIVLGLFLALIISKVKRQLTS